jgi:hypothetical protein
MMDFAKLIESTTAPTGASFPKLDQEGTYIVSVLEANYAKTKDGTKSQGVLKVEVIEGEKATARCNLYIGAGTNDQQAAMNVKPYYDTLINIGVSKDKLIDDATNWNEVIANVVSQLTKQISRGNVIKLNLTLKINTKKSTDEVKDFYKNVSIYTAPEAVAESAPVDESTAPKAKVTKAPKIPEAKIPAVEAEDTLEWMND